MERNSMRLFLSLLLVLGLASASLGAARKPVPVKPKPKPLVAAPRPQPAPVKRNLLTGRVLYPRLSVVLPSNGSVKVRWVSPPVEDVNLDEADRRQLGFAVDAAGHPWIARNRRTLLRPTKQLLLSLARPFTGFVCLDNGALLIATPTELGFALLPGKPANADTGPVAAFQPICPLPQPGSRIFAGAGKSLYAVGPNAATGEDEVYRLRPEQLTPEGKEALHGFRKVFATREAIAAATGDGDVTYVATGRLVLKVTGDGKVEKLYLDPTDPITGLAAVDGGVCYATAKSVGVIGPTGAVPLLAASDPQLAVQGDSLYVLVSDSLGVLALDGAPALARANLAVAEVPATRSEEVRVTSLRLFEGGEELPAEAPRMYSRRFTREQTRYIYCQVDLQNLLKGKRSHRQSLLLELGLTGNPYGVNRVGWQGDFAPDEPAKTALVRFGAKAEGQFFWPGEWVLKTYLNGVKVDERFFTMVGEADFRGAVIMGNAEWVRQALRKGADPNKPFIVWEWNRPPLLLAVWLGHTECVRLLLESGAKPNVTDEFGATPAMRAITGRPSPTILRLLLDAGADAKAIDKEGNPLLHLAVKAKQPEAVRLLLEHGADPEMKDKANKTPLTVAIPDEPGKEKDLSLECMDVLLSHKVDPNSYGERSPPLQFAISGSYGEAVARLLKAGASVHREGTDPRTGFGTSMLQFALARQEAAKDLPSRQKARVVLDLLLAQNPNLNLKPEEAKRYLNAASERRLGAKMMQMVIRSARDGIRDYWPEDPSLRPVVLSALLWQAFVKILSPRRVEEYGAPLALCEEAERRALAWEMTAQLPPILFNCGLLNARLGNNSRAADYLKRCLALVPDSKEAKDLLRAVQGGGATVAGERWREADAWQEQVA